MALKKNQLEQLWEIQSSPLKPLVKSQLLVPTGRGNTYAARDYIHANAVVSAAIKQGLNLSEFNYLNEIYSALDPLTSFRLKFYTPCLAYRFDEFKPSEKEDFFNNPDWVFTEKQNGVRGILCFHKGQAKLFSRNYSDVDCSVLDYWPNILQSFDSDETLILDVEIKFEPGFLYQEELEKFNLSTDSRLEAMCALLQMHPESARQIQANFKAEKSIDLITFRLIHPLYYKGVNYMKKPLGYGMKVYDEVIQFAQSHGLNVKPIRHCKGDKFQKESFLDGIIAEGGEGIVGHYTKGFYCTSENRSKTSFVKLKRSVSQVASKNGVSDTIDGWVSGYKLGTPGTANENRVAVFEISCYILEPNGEMTPHVIAYTPNVAKEVSDKITCFDESGKAYLDPEFLGTVVELDGQNISKVSLRLTHPRLLRYRFEKSKDECIYTRDFILSQVD